MLDAEADERQRRRRLCPVRERREAGHCRSRLRALRALRDIVRNTGMAPLAGAEALTDRGPAQVRARARWMQCGGSLGSTAHGSP